MVQSMVRKALSRPLSPKGLVFNSHEPRFAQELLKLMNKLKPQIPPTPPLTPIIPTKLGEILRDKVDIFGKRDQQVWYITRRAWCLSSLVTFGA